MLDFFAARKICFVESDDIKPKLLRIRDDGRQLWCDGKELVVVLNTDDLPASKKMKEQKVSAKEEKKKKS